MLGGRDETRGDAAGGRSGSALGRGHLRPLSSQVVDRASISTITHDQQRSGVVLTGSSRSSQTEAAALTAALERRAEPHQDPDGHEPAQGAPRDPGLAKRSGASAPTLGGVQG